MCWCCPAVSQQMRTSTSLRLLLKNPTYLYLRQQLWPLELSSVPVTESSSGRLQDDFVKCNTPKVFLFLSLQARKHKGKKRSRKGRKTERRRVDKVLLHSKGHFSLSEYITQFIGAGIQKQPNLIFFFFFKPSEPRLAPLCCVQRSVHLFSTTGKVFVFICFYKLRGAEAFRGATVFLSPPL